MGRKTSSSFILTLKLNTSHRQDAILNDRFFAAWKMRNQMAKYAFKQLCKFKMDRRYKENIKLLPSPSRTTQFVALRQEYGLSEFSFHRWIKEQQHRYDRYVDSNTAQKIATHVWQGVETCIFGKGNTVHVYPFEEFCAVEGKDNSAGIKYREGYIVWLGEQFALQIDKNDKYAQNALRRKIKYCRIVRRPVGSRYHYYAQLVLSGDPPQKHQYRQGGLVGLDSGISSEAVVTKNQCVLKVVAPELEKTICQLVRVERQMERSRRITNPQNFNADGTISAGEYIWFKSNHYKRLQIKHKSIRRRNTAYIRQCEEIFANYILETCGSDIISEKMNYRALQKRKCNEQISFGYSLATHAPARFLDILNRKLGYIDKEIFFVDTAKYKASQYDHTTDTYTKAKLDARSKIVDGIKVQRDLYSAFLLLCAEDEEKPNRQKCFSLFPTFVENQNKCIAALKQNGKTYPSSFGLRDF